MIGQEEKKKRALNLLVTYKGNMINLSVWLSKIFNGTAFSHEGYKDVTRLDLRTELGIYAFALKQGVPITLNQCLIRAFYFIRRLFLEINAKDIHSLKSLKKLESKNFLPSNICNKLFTPGQFRRNCQFGFFCQKGC